MKQPNTHFIRQFNDKARSANRLILEQPDIRNLQSELLDVLLYIRELEEEIKQLQEKQNESIEVVMQGDNF